MGQTDPGHDLRPFRGSGPIGNVVSMKSTDSVSEASAAHCPCPALLVGQEA